MCWFIWVFFLFLLGVGEGFEYLVVVGCSGRVAQDGLALLPKHGSWVFLQGSRIEHRSPKSVVVGSNPTPPAKRLQPICKLSSGEALQVIGCMFQKEFFLSRSEQACKFFITRY